MSERKVLNKYYPPDFDPAKIPRLRRTKNHVFNIRIMAPFNMRCNTCGEYIYKGKKFNSRKESVLDEDYLGLHIHRFYIKCPRCVAEIAFKTDPENTDYSLEAGATRNFEALRTAEMLAQKEEDAKLEEEKDNPMLVLEKRTKMSQQEMEMIETLEDLQQINSRHAKVNYQGMIQKYRDYEEEMKKKEEEEDEQMVRSIFGKNEEGESIKRLKDDDEDSEEPVKKLAKTSNPTDLLTSGGVSKKASLGGRAGASSKSKFGVLVKKKSTSSKEPSESTSKVSNTSKEKPAEHPGVIPVVTPVGAENNPAQSKPSPGVAGNKPAQSKPTPGPSGGLGLLGNYSCSDDSDSSS